jgi:hypothetical protein
MLQFSSASLRLVNSQRAIEECLDVALGTDPAASADCSLVVIHASLGHPLKDLVEPVRRRCPRARVVASSCCGVVGKEGVSESMKDLAIMAVRGPEVAVTHVDGIFGHNSFEKSAEMARALKDKLPATNMVCVLASGIDIDDDNIIKGIESVFGTKVTIFGATSADNMRGIVSYQAVDGEVFQHGAYLVGFGDPTLEVDTQATHGFVAVGEPMTVTKSTGNRIHELDGKPAWTEFTSRLGLQPTATPGDTIPVGALAEALSPALAEEYGNKHLLRVVTRRDDDGTMHYATTCPVGTKLWLTVRDEALIFSDLDRMMASMNRRAGGRKPVAVFHADCLARGRFLFNRVMKDELVSRMQFPLSTDGAPPPWLGMYGFGEFARLGGANTYHNYTTALYALYRR